MWGVANGVGPGVNLGTGGHAVGSTAGNCGVSGLADAATAGYNIGTSGWAANGAVNVGGWFTLNQTTVPPATAALIADNGPATPSPTIALFNLNGTSVAGIGFTGTLASTPATLAAGQQALTVVAQQPATPTSAQSAVSCTITGAGIAPQNNNAFFLSYAAGYLGPNRSTALNCDNLNAGTGAILPVSGSNAFVGNIGVQGVAASATITTGNNVGVYGQASGGSINFGTFGVAQMAQSSATNVGIAGFAINTAASSTGQIGVLASLNSANVPSASAAIIADNGSRTNPVALFQVAGVSKAQVDANGNIGYITGAGGAVSQTTSRTTAVTLNKSTGQITMFSAAATAAATFTVNNTMVAATDVIQLSVSSSTNLYFPSVTAVRSNSFDITVQTTTTSVDAPVINFAVIKGANS